jgi:hypothetical protein
MSTALSDIITAVRDAHPAFDDKRVGNALIARWMTDFQRRLHQKSLNYNKFLVTSRMPVSLVPSDDNTAPYAGAGQVGELPADSASGSETVSPDEKDVGNAVVITEGAVAVAEIVLTSATATTFTKTAAAWVVNAYATDYMVKIVRGTGAGQQRQIISNTSDTGTVDEWREVPDSTSVAKILAFTLSADVGGMGAVTDFPLQDDRLGYLVRTDSSGNPYIDWTVPVLGKITLGIPLPQHHVVFDGNVYFDDGETDKLTIVGAQRRYRAPGDFPAYIENGQLYLIGGLETWEEVASLELRYVPIAPALTAVTSLFILPDSAAEALKTYAALKAAVRLEALGVQINTNWFATEHVDARDEWLQTLSQQRRARISQIIA